jgi:hypothetical protein
MASSMRARPGDVPENKAEMSMRGITGGLGLHGAPPVKLKNGGSSAPREPARE